MMAVMKGATRWAAHWDNSEIIFITDSAVVQAALNMGKLRSPEIMKMVRELFCRT